MWIFKLVCIVIILGKYVLLSTVATSMIDETPVMVYRELLGKGKFDPVCLPKSRWDTPIFDEEYNTTGQTERFIPVRIPENAFIKIDVARKIGDCTVFLLPHKHSREWTFVNMTKGHICPCRFKSIEAAMLDMCRSEDVDDWKFSICNLIDPAKETEEEP